MSYRRDYEKKIRLGVVGVGGHAYRNLLPAMTFLPVDLIALCDLNEGLLQKTAREYGISKIYTDAGRMFAEEGLDAVVLCVGPHKHPELARLAFGAGLHVWMEKPPAMRVSEIEDLMRVQGDRVCLVGLKKAFMPATRKARELLETPGFGSLRSILAIYPMTVPSDGTEILAERRLTNWLANGCHPLSLLLELGGSVRKVNIVRGSGNESVGAVCMEFENGAMGTLHLAAGVPPGAPVERYILFGEGRVIEIENCSRVLYHRGIPFDYGRQKDFYGPGEDSGTVVWEVTHTLATLENKALFVQGFFNELSEFCQAILESRVPYTGTLEFARRVMGVYEAVLGEKRQGSGND